MKLEPSQRFGERASVALEPSAKESERPLPSSTPQKSPLVPAGINERMASPSPAASPDRREKERRQHLQRWLGDQGTQETETLSSEELRLRDMLAEAKAEAEKRRKTHWRWFWRGILLLVVGASLGVLIHTQTFAQIAHWQRMEWSLWSAFFSGGMLIYILGMNRR